MVSIKFSAAKWQQDSDGNLWLMLKTGRESAFAVRKFVSEIKDKIYVATLKLFRNHRSTDANAYLWTLLQKLAEATNVPKEEIYVEFVRKFGKFEPVLVAEKAVDSWIKAWEARGIGWRCEVMGGVVHDGFKTILCYFGSSVYDTKEMSRLIGEVVAECKEQGIDTMSPDELESLYREIGA